MIAIALMNVDPGFLPTKVGSGDINYDMVIPQLLMKYFPTGVLGLGLTALLASFMSGMAGNVSAFNTIWTYDIYQSYINPKKSDKHYLQGGTAYHRIRYPGQYPGCLCSENVQQCNGLPAADFCVYKCTFVCNLPAGDVLEKGNRTRCFLGLVHRYHGCSHTSWPDTARRSFITYQRWLAWTVVHTYPSEMAQNFWTAIYAFVTAFVFTVVISLFTKQLKTDSELKGLVYSLTPKPEDDSKHWYQKPVVMAVFVGIIAMTLSIIFW